MPWMLQGMPSRNGITRAWSQRSARNRGRLGRVLLASHPAQELRPAVEPLAGVARPGRAGAPVQPPGRRPEGLRLGRHHRRRRPGDAQVVPELVDHDLVLQPPPLGPPRPVDPPAGDLRQLVEHRAQHQRPPLRVPPVEGVRDLGRQEPQQLHGRPDLGQDVGRPELDHAPLGLVRPGDLPGPHPGGEQERPLRPQLPQPPAGPGQRGQRPPGQHHLPPGEHRPELLDEAGSHVAPPLRRRRPWPGGGAPRG